MPISFSGGLFTAERKLVQSQGREAFYGLVGRFSNEVMLIGEGRLDDGTGVWTYEFHGKFDPNGTMTLKGNLHFRCGSGRVCAIKFG
jgi:hypothetical protein